MAKELFQFFFTIYIQEFNVWKIRVAKLIENGVCFVKNLLYSDLDFFRPGVMWICDVC
jgi:hypothetical protein